MNQIITIFIQEKEIENVSKMVSILSLAQCANALIVPLTAQAWHQWSYYEQYPNEISVDV